MNSCAGPRHSSRCTAEPVHCLLTSIPRQASKNTQVVSTKGAVNTGTPNGPSTLNAAPCTIVVQTAPSSAQASAAGAGRRKMQPSAGAVSAAE